MPKPGLRLCPTAPPPQTPALRITLARENRGRRPVDDVELPLPFASRIEQKVKGSGFGPIFWPTFGCAPVAVPEPTAGTPQPGLASCHWGWMWDGVEG